MPKGWRQRRQTMEETNTTEHVVDVNKLASSIGRKLSHKSPSASECCIFKVPHILRRHNKDVYVPNVISIGPLHHRNQNLKEMEELKLWYLHSLLSRSQNDLDETLASLISEITELEEQVRKSYSVPLKFSEEELVEMMIIDGCFLIELFRKFSQAAPVHRDDPTFNMQWMLPNLRLDLLLIENQIPWFILECLYNSTVDPQRGIPTLTGLALQFFDNMMLMTVPAKLDERIQNKHLLDLVRNALLPSHGEMETDGTDGDIIPNVTKLLEAGIKFKAGSADDMLKIKFVNGVLEIPPIMIQENAESLFRNLIAYEQCKPNLTDEIASYALLLDNLIDSSMDVEFLRQKGIIKNSLSTEDISFFFNRLYNDACLYKYYYGELAKQVNGHCRSRCPRWRATLKHDYFRTPWSILSFLAAVIILVLTFIQTLFTVLSYN